MNSRISLRTDCHGARSCAGRHIRPGPRRRARYGDGQCYNPDFNHGDHGQAGQRHCAPRCFSKFSHNDAEASWKDIVGERAVIEAKPNADKKLVAVSVRVGTGSSSVTMDKKMDHSKMDMKKKIASTKSKKTSSLRRRNDNEQNEQVWTLGLYLCCA